MERAGLYPPFPYSFFIGLLAITFLAVIAAATIYFFLTGTIILVIGIALNYYRPGRMPGKCNSCLF
jgi:hypothetical protein